MNHRITRVRTLLGVAGIAIAAVAPAAMAKRPSSTVCPEFTGTNSRSSRARRRTSSSRQVMPVPPTTRPSKEPDCGKRLIVEDDKTTYAEEGRLPAGQGSWVNSDTIGKKAICVNLTPPLSDAGPEAEPNIAGKHDGCTF